MTLSLRQRHPIQPREISSRGFLLLAALLSLSGCKTLQADKEGQLQLFASKAPRAWTAAHPLSADTSTEWVSSFGKELKSLVDTGLAESPDLKVTAARVAELKALAKIEGAALLPTADTDAGANRSQRPTGTRFAGLDAITNRFQANLNISWELDFWGKNRDRRNSALTTAQAAEEDLHAAKLSLAANIVKAGLTVLELRQLQDVAAGNAEALKAQVKVQEQQVQRGINADRAALDLSLAKADLARAEAAKATRQREADAARRTLEALLGRYPRGAENGPRTLPSLGRSLSAGAPSLLLLRRPDIRAAERRLQAAVHDESAAKKEFLPTIRLTGGKGYSSQFVEDLFTQQSVLWSAASNLAQPLISQGRLKGGVHVAQSRYQRAVQQYQVTALTAFREVETALAADGFYATQVAALVEAEKEAQRALQLARSSYEAGLSDILTVLDSTRRAFDGRTALLSAQIARLKNRADLHLALGGKL
jgi:outer membrane protein, multidrug efflux system